MATVSRQQKVRLGIFVGVGLALLLGGFMALVGKTLVEARDTYTIRFQDRDISFSGLEVGSSVKYSGIQIGRVESLRIAPDDVSVIEVVVSVAQGTPIAEDSKASLASQGITGLKYVELSRGSPGVRTRKPGETIPSGASLIDELSAKATSIAEKLEQLLQNIQKMTGPTAQDDVQHILTSTAGLLEDNRANIAEIVANAREVSGDLARFSEKGVQVADKADQLMAKLNVVGTEIQSVLGPNGQLVTTVDKTDKLIDRLNILILRSESDLEVTMRNLRDTSANLNDFSLAVRDNPSLLISSPKLSDSTEGR